MAELEERRDLGVNGAKEGEEGLERAVTQAIKS